MTYDPNIPMATDLLSQSQSDIQSNFAAIKALIDINHATFGNAQQGKHIYVELPVQSIPPIVFDAGEVAIYSGLNTQTSRNELYINKTNQATVKQIPATASTLSVTSTPASGSVFWTYLPSGIIMYCGGGTGTGNVPINVTTIPNAPTPSQLLTVLLTPVSITAGDQNFAVRLLSITPNTPTFTAYVSLRTTTGPANGSFSFLAFGYQ